MKKIIFSILINIFLLSFVIFAIDFLSVLKSHIDNRNFVKKEIMANHSQTNESDNILPRFRYSFLKKSFAEHWYKTREGFSSLKRLSFVKDSKKKSVILFGCSFVEGVILSDEEAFAHQLSKKTGRTVYNRGFSGFGPAPMLWQVRNKDFYDDIKVEPEYAIYVYIFDHLRRIYFDKYGFTDNIYLGYELENNNLVEKKPPLFYLNYFNLVKNYTIDKILYSQMLSEDKNDYNFEILKKFFIESKNELQKRYPNIKFVIVKHPSQLFNNRPMLESCRSTYFSKRWKELENEGFIVYDLANSISFDISSDEYVFPDQHPNAKAWEIISGNITNNLNL